MMAAGNHRFWIDTTLECVRRDHTGGPGNQTGPFRTARALGMALAAPNEVNALAAGGNSLLQLGPFPGMKRLAGKPLEVAACAACSQVLKLRYPLQAAVLDSAWTVWLQTMGQVQPGSAEELAGRAVGEAIHAIGASDATAAAGNMFAPSGLPLTHMAPPNQPGQSFAGADWGFATRLLTTRVTGFPSPPGRVSGTAVASPGPHPNHYEQDFDKVKAKGAINSGPAAPGRTVPEEFIGIAWGYDGASGLGTPPRLYMQAVLSVLDAKAAAVPPAPRLTVAQELELIAGIGLVMAEAGIDAWHYKYAPTHMMWRPAVGIPKAPPGFGVADPSFLPLGRPDTNKRGLALTPDFPAYPSGHATFGASAFQLLRLYLTAKGLATFDANGVDNIPLNFISDEYNGVNTDPRDGLPRPLQPVTATSLWDAILQNSLSRVYLGVHWQFDGVTTRNAANTGDDFGVPATPSKLGRTGGVWLGGQVANQVAAKLGVPPPVIAASKLA